MKSITDKSGLSWALLGHAFSVTGDPLDEPAIAVSNSTTAAIPGIVRDWSGRWLLLSSRAVITDAAGLLGTYIYESDAGLILTGSLALLAETVPQKIRDSRILGWYGLNWYPCPLSKYAYVRKLLPDQIYHPDTQTISRNDRLDSCVQTSTEGAAESIAKGLGHVFCAMHAADPGGGMALALTAGLDSRTNYSALVASGVPFSTMTMEHPRISSADRTLPQSISSKHGISFQFIRAKPYELRKQVEYDRHTDSTVVDGDRYFFACGSFDAMASKWLIRSGCWEIGRQYFHRKLQGLELGEVHDHPERLVRRFKSLFNIEASAIAIRSWARWRLDQPTSLDWQDLFYRDQRLAGWLSSVEQSLDLIDPISIHPVNCDYFYGLLLGGGESEFSDRPRIQQEIVNLCSPDLNGIAVNPHLDGLRYRARGVLSQIWTVASGEATNVGRAARRSRT